MEGGCVDDYGLGVLWCGEGEIGSVKPGLRPPFRRRLTFQGFSGDRGYLMCAQGIRS